MTTSPSTWHQCKSRACELQHHCLHSYTRTLMPFMITAFHGDTSEQQSTVCLPAHLHEVQAEKLGVTQPLQFAPSPDIGLQQVGLILCGHALQNCPHIICCLEGLRVELDDCMRNPLPGHPATCKVCSVNTLLSCPLQWKPLQSPSPLPFCNTHPDIRTTTHMHKAAMADKL